MILQVGVQGGAGRGGGGAGWCGAGGDSIEPCALTDPSCLLALGAY